MKHILQALSILTGILTLITVIMLITITTSVHRTLWITILCCAVTPYQLFVTIPNIIRLTYPSHGRHRTHPQNRTHHD